MWCLEVIRSPAALPKVIPLQPGRTMLGREDCDLALHDPRVSARHCSVVLEDGRVEVIDHHSTNGTFLAGARVQRAPWPPGQSLALGGTELRLVERPVARTGTGDTSKVAISNREFDFSIVAERKIAAEEGGVAPGEAAEASEAGRIESLLRRMRVLQEGVRTLNRAPSVPELLDRAMRLLFEAVQCDTGYILITGDSGNPETVRAHLAYEGGKRKDNLAERLYSRTLVSKVLESKAGILFDSEDGGTSLMGGADQSLSILQLRIKTALCCPIHSEGRVFGVIYLDNKKRGSKFTGDDLDLAMNVAGIAGMAVENLELGRKLQTEAQIRDNLKRFVSPNVAEKIIAERGDFHLQSQKTQVSVLFADIRGFTPLSEALSPVTVARILNAYFSQMCAVVFENGGTLDKFIGDCMMVLFNAPIPMPDPEGAAVRTAVGMRRRLAQILPEWRRQGLPDIRMGIGINSGEAVVGSLGTENRMEYTAIGDAVNIASRLCGIAKPDQILVGESVHDRVREHFRTHMLGSTQLKGRSRQVLVYEIVDDLVMPG